MQFFIYHRPLYSKIRGEFIGDLLHITKDDMDYSPDGMKWKRKRCNRSEGVYNRLISMLTSAGMGEDMVYPLDGKRSVKDLVNYMNKWET